MGKDVLRFFVRVSWSIEVVKLLVLMLLLLINTEVEVLVRNDFIVLIQLEVLSSHFVFELKNHKSLSLPEFWRQAQVEAVNYAKARGLDEVPLHYVVAKRRNAGISQSWVIQDLEQWLKEKQG